MYISLEHIVPTCGHMRTGRATKSKIQEVGEGNEVMPLPLPSSYRVRGQPLYVSRGHSKGNLL